MVKETRRRLLQQAAGLVAFSRFAPIPRFNTQAAPPSLQSTFPTVSVAQGTATDSFFAILKTALDGLGGLERFVKKGQLVAIKPNATWDSPPGTASSTHPEVLRALIQMVRQLGAEVVVVDHCSIDPGTAECLRINGIGKLVDEMKVESVFPDRWYSPPEVYTDIEVPKGVVVKSLSVIKRAVEADVRINMAVPKCHIVTKLTLCLKHMMGFLGDPYGVHPLGLEQGLADLSTPSKIQAQLHILESIWVRMPIPGPSGFVAGGPETHETYPEKIPEFNQIVAGTDPVLIDTYGLATYFKREPRELPHVQIAGEMGLGETDLAKATTEGRLRVYKVGEPVFTATPSPTPRPTSVDTATPTATGPRPTDTPQPTATAAPVSETGSRPPFDIARTETVQAEGLVNLTPILSGALVPSAVILAGVGAVVQRRVRHKDAAKPEATPDDK
jgi:uncharacterized protein (DUF362 family)